MTRLRDSLGDLVDQLTKALHSPRQNSLDQCSRNLSVMLLPPLHIFCPDPKMWKPERSYKTMALEEYEGTIDEDGRVG